QAEDGIRDFHVTGVQTCALPILPTEPGTDAEQWITLVAPQHRGHRLGLLIKLENHRQLRRERPAVRWIHTGNADVNRHMIAINELLGFQVVDAWREYQRKL